MCDNNARAATFSIAARSHFLDSLDWNQFNTIMNVNFTDHIHSTWRIYSCMNASALHPECTAQTRRIADTEGLAFGEQE